MLLVLLPLGPATIILLLWQGALIALFALVGVLTTAGCVLGAGMAVSDCLGLSALGVGLTAASLLSMVSCVLLLALVTVPSLELRYKV